MKDSLGDSALTNSGFSLKFPKFPKLDWLNEELSELGWDWMEDDNDMKEDDADDWSELGLDPDDCNAPLKEW